MRTSAVSLLDILSVFFQWTCCDGAFLKTFFINCGSTKLLVLVGLNCDPFWKNQKNQNLFQMAAVAFISYFAALFFFFFNSINFSLSLYRGCANCYWTSGELCLSCLSVFKIENSCKVISIMENLYIAVLQHRLLNFLLSSNHLTVSW